MKKLILVFAASVCSFQIWSQGTFQVTAGASVKTTGNAYLVLDNMHLVNNGSFQQTSGNGIVKLSGPLSTALSGGSTTTFNQLLMSKIGDASFDLQTDLSVLSKVTFNSGLLNLNNSMLDLASTGSLVGESEFSRAFTTGTGYIQVAGILNNPSAANLGNLGAEITSTKNLGHTIIKRGHLEQTGISGSNNSILRYFDIMPTNNMALKASLRFYYFDAELNSIPEGTLYQWKSANLVNWDFSGADTRDQSANYVEWKTYSKFDRVALATATAPAITCPPNQTVSANMPGCKASVSFAASSTGIPAPSIVYRIGNSVISSPHVFSKGTTTVTATASNGVSPDASCTFTVTVVCGPVSPSMTQSETMPEEIIVGKLVVAARPNPSAGHFILDIKSSNQAPVSIRIIDIVGRVVSTQSNLASNTRVEIGQKFLPGIYFVQAIQGRQVVTLRLIKQ